MWLQLVRPYRIVQAGGRPIMHEPGEMLHFKNKDDAKRLIQDGFAIDIAASQAVIPDGCGVLVRGKVSDAPHWIEAMNLDWRCSDRFEELPYPMTIMWDPRYSPNCLQLGPTFRTMREFAWDLAVPIKSYGKLTGDIGSAEERTRTEAVIHDLRVPYYNTHLMFVRQNERTAALMKAWHKERAEKSDESLAFMRALYRVKPYILALPVEAVQRRAA